jgi:hypothetical protein
VGLGFGGGACRVLGDGKGEGEARGSHARTHFATLHPLVNLFY